ncbi:MAG: cardiolipin synthase B, partial [Pseudomonadota bacterium]|nr:cardiolipin synthase B [Pseudomonadota bacterium]
MSWGLAFIIAIVVALAGLLLANFLGGEKKITRDIRRQYGLDEVRFLDELGLLLGPPFVQGNRVQTLLNGDEIFPPMLAAIRTAHTSITFETYIYWAGDIGRTFAEALSERARAGVKVHVL